MKQASRQKQVSAGVGCRDASLLAGRGDNSVPQQRLAVLLLTALAIAVLACGYLFERGRTKNFVAAELALYGKVANVEVIAFPNIIVPTTGPDHELFKDGCRFRSADPRRIRQLIDDITDFDGAASGDRPDFGMNDLAVVLTSASGHQTTLLSGKKGSDSSLALLRGTREVGRYLEKSDALEYRVYAWINQMPVNAGDGFSDLCHARADRYVTDKIREIGLLF